jgi:hypothetical protein
VKENVSTIYSFRLFSLSFDVGEMMRWSSDADWSSWAQKFACHSYCCGSEGVWSGAVKYRSWRTSGMNVSATLD